MSLIHRGGRVDPPSIVQPDSCPSVLTPSLPPSTDFLSLFSPWSLSPSLFSYSIPWAGSQGQAGHEDLGN